MVRSYIVGVSLFDTIKKIGKAKYAQRSQATSNMQQSFSPPPPSRERERGESTSSVLAGGLLGQTASISGIPGHSTSQSECSELSNQSDGVRARAQPDRVADRHVSSDGSCAQQHSSGAESMQWNAGSENANASAFSGWQQAAIPTAILPYSYLIPSTLPPARALDNQAGPRGTPLLFPVPLRMTGTAGQLSSLGIPGAAPLQIPINIDSSQPNLTGGVRNLGINSVDDLLGFSSVSEPNCGARFGPSASKRLKPFRDSEGDMLADDACTE